MIDQRSTIASQNLDEVLEASASVKAATLAGQQQYSTPLAWASYFAELLPDHYPEAVFDPQCAGGNLFNGFGYGAAKLGWDIDKRFVDEDIRVKRCTGNCVKLWAMLDDIFPELRFECQVANPPFGLKWRLPGGGVVDSTLHTWLKLIERTAEGGYGYFIANHATIERFGMHGHPWVYLYLKFPAGFFPKTEVEPGVVFWHNSPERFKGLREPVIFRTLSLDDPNWHILAAVRDHYELYRPDVPDRYDRKVVLVEAWGQLNEILAEEARLRPEWNVFLDGEGLLGVYLSTRDQIKRKINRSEVERLVRLKGCHPLALTTEAETRRLLAMLVAEGAYTVQPEARRAIESALAEVTAMSAPLMPVTDFELVAYADELDCLTVREDYPASLKEAEDAGFHFIAGHKYPLRTATYAWTSKFFRLKVHFSEEGEEEKVKHECAVSGQDRYIAVTDEEGVEHRFMDHPREKAHGLALEEHGEGWLWQIFEKPTCKTVAELSPEQVDLNRQRLLAIQEQINAAWTNKP